MPHPSRCASLGKDSYEIRQARVYSCNMYPCTCYARGKQVSPPRDINWAPSHSSRTLGISPFRRPTRPLDNLCSFLNIEILRFRQNANDAMNFSCRYLMQPQQGGRKVPTTMLYATMMIKTSMLFLNDRLLEVRTACERKATRDTPTANPNTDQANIWSTPVKSFLTWCDIMDIQTGAHCAQ